MPDTSVTDTAVPALAADEEVLVGLLARVFRTDPIAEWVFPDAARRDAVLPRFFGILYSAAVGNGGAYTNAARTGVLLSLPANATEPPELVGALIEAVGEDAVRFGTVAQAQAERRPERPHQYFTFGGLDPSVQGHGVAGALFASVLRQCDADGVGGYLEASSPAGLAVAHRHGFTEFGDEIRMPDGPALQPMWRDARALD